MFSETDWSMVALSAVVPMPRKDTWVPVELTAFPNSRLGTLAANA